MSNFERTAQWLAACGKEVGHKQNLSTQIGCHMEEFLEFTKTLAFSGDGETAVFLTPLQVQAAIETLNRFATEIKRGSIVATIPREARAECLDSLCDMQVTGDGVAWLADFNKIAADEAVLQANEAKLVDGKPVILEGGKIGKPEGWTPADLSRFV
jgi:predicted HAD superfamily Cof-like phosphohydrolase